MISKELLSLVLDIEIYAVIHHKVDKNEIYYTDSMYDNYEDGINAYELANKCKKWATKKGYNLTSGGYILDDRFVCDLFPLDCGQQTIADTEYEAVFKACQWILDEKH